MKLKTISLLVGAFVFLPVTSSAQAPAAPVAPKAEVEAWVPSTPLEKKAKSLVDTMKKLPVILSKIKDQGTLDTAKKSMEAVNQEIDAHVVDIKKLPVPDNATRNALSDRMEKETASLGPAMQKAMMGMAGLAPELAPQVQELMMSFANNMQKYEADMNQYFQSDEERAKKKGE